MDKITENTFLKGYNDVAKVLSKELGLGTADITYYSKVMEWNEWYKGYVKEFHNVSCSNGVNVVKRDIYMLKMAKRVAEDWASAVLSEPVSIAIEGDRNKSSVFVQGSRGDGGVLGSNDFTLLLSDALETSFALGSSALVVGLDIEEVNDSDNILISNKNRISLQVFDALSIIPISWNKTKVTECAFLSYITKDGKTFRLLNVHVKGDNGYVIRNFVLDKDGMEISSLDFGIVDILETHSLVPYFVIFRPNIVNNISRLTPLGVSIFADSIDNLKGCDIGYDACIREVITGQRIIFFNKMLLTTDDTGRPIVPNDARQSYMQFFGDEALSDVKEFIKEFHPTLNTENLNKELQNQLNMLSMKCGLGSHYYNFSIVSGVTATEYLGEHQDFQRNAVKQCSFIKTCIRDLVKAILSAGKVFLGAAVNPDVKIVVTMSDGFVEDDTKQREQDRLDVKEGLMSKAEYRAKWYGETIEQAKEVLDAMAGNTPKTEEVE